MAFWIFPALLFLVAAHTATAQTNFSAWCLIDTPPITGTTGRADTLANGLIIGEVNEAQIFPNGLYRSELIVELPAAPPSSILSNASLGLYLESNTGTTNGNPTFGPLQVYHRGVDQFYVSDADYADGSFTHVGELLEPVSPAGRYYYIDVKAEVLADYAAGAAGAYGKFRFQVDGMQFIGSGSHMYEFHFSSNAPVYPAILSLQFQPLGTPLLSSSWKSSSSGLTLSWPTNSGNFVLESSTSPTTSTWMAVTNAPAIVGGHFLVEVGGDQQQQFFRLRRDL